MTIKVTIDPGSHAARVTIDDQATGRDVVRIEPGSVRDFNAYPGRTITVEELVDDGSGDRPLDPGAAQSEG